MAAAKRTKRRAAARLTRTPRSLPRTSLPRCGEEEGRRGGGLSAICAPASWHFCLPLAPASPLPPFTNAPAILPLPRALSPLSHSNIAAISRQCRGNAMLNVVWIYRICLHPRLSVGIGAACVIFFMAGVWRAARGFSVKDGTPSSSPPPLAYLYLSVAADWRRRMLRRSQEHASIDHDFSERRTPGWLLHRWRDRAR